MLGDFANATAVVCGLKGLPAHDQLRLKNIYIFKISLEPHWADLSFSIISLVRTRWWRCGSRNLLEVAAQAAILRTLQEREAVVLAGATKSAKLAAMEARKLREVRLVFQPQPF